MGTVSATLTTLKTVAPPRGQGVTMLPDAAAAPVKWRVANGPVGYEKALEQMTRQATAIAAGEADELVWLLEHPPLYTAGTSADPAELIEPSRFPVFKTGRGGRYTYHGPGQRIAYVMLDLKRRKPDVRAFVATLEHWIIDALGQFNVRGERRQDRVGVWVRRPDLAPLRNGEAREDKIAAIGIRLSRWVSLHGISINVEPDLSHFAGIVPCGVTGHGVTSLIDLGHTLTIADVDDALRCCFEPLFGATVIPKEPDIDPLDHDDFVFD